MPVACYTVLLTLACVLLVLSTCTLGLGEFQCSVPLLSAEVSPSSARKRTLSCVVRMRRLLWSGALFIWGKRSIGCISGTGMLQCTLGARATVPIGQMSF